MKRDAVQRGHALFVGLVLLVAAVLARPVAASPWSVAAMREGPAPPGGLRRGAPTVDETAGASRREAAAAFADAEAAFDRGEYPLAAVRFGRAHALLPHPWTLYNLALSRARAGDARGAWQAFDELGERAPTAAERKEARAERDALRPMLAFVQVKGEPRGSACIDGVQIELDARGEAGRVLEPGAHRLAGPRSDRTLDLAAGTTTLLDAHAAPRAKPKARPWLAVATAMSGLATGGAIGAAVTADAPLGKGLAGAAAGASAIALAASIAGLVIVSKQGAAPPPQSPCAAG